MDDAKKYQPMYTQSQMLEEKRKVAEEKQRQAKLQREAIEKEKREQALKLQFERDERSRKILKEKEEKMRMDAQKKKMAKEKQAQKYAAEKAKKPEFVTPKPVEPKTPLNSSLHLVLQKQILSEKTAQQKKEESQATYSFDMLHTDDSTDDESRPSKKRPPAPQWSRSKYFHPLCLDVFPNKCFYNFSETARKPLLAMQSHVDSNVLDTLFSCQPISVDLRDIFPAIDPRKLVRNSSAVWRTPPKHY